MSTAHHAAEAMPPDPVTALDERVNRLEEAIAAGLNRIESLLRQQIQDLKTEQLRDMKDELRRLADDQRRLWDAVRDLEKVRNLNAGGIRVINSIWNLISAGIGAGIMALLNGFSGGSGHPPAH